MLRKLLPQASHKMPITTPAGPAATWGVRLGLCPVRRDVRAAGGGEQVGCGGATSSHWDTAGAGAVLQLSPPQIPASPEAVTGAPAGLWNSPGGISRSPGRCRVPAVPQCVPSSQGARSTPAVCPHPRHRVI